MRSVRTAVVHGSDAGARTQTSQAVRVGVCQMMLRFRRWRESILIRTNSTHQ